MINGASFRYPKEPQIHFVASEKDLTLCDILRALEQENFKIVRVKEAKSKEELLHEIATLMALPDYFNGKGDGSDLVVLPAVAATKASVPSTLFPSTLSESFCPLYSPLYSLYSLYSLYFPSTRPVTGMRRGLVARQPATMEDTLLASIWRHATLLKEVTGFKTEVVSDIDLGKLRTEVLSGSDPKANMPVRDHSCFRS